MKTVTSADGTTIAYDQVGQGPPVIVIGGAFSYRAYPGWVKLVGLLAEHFTVINYDRRGRGDSTDTAPYAVEREIEDLEMLIKEAGGSAYVFGLSSGAVLAMRAVASGLNIEKLALYEPPFSVDGAASAPPADLEEHLKSLVAAGRRGDAVKYFMRTGMGVPAPIVTLMRIMPGVWKRLTAVAHTLPYDVALMGSTLSGKPLSAAEWAPVTVPTAVIGGAKSPAALRSAAKAAADVLPAARLRMLAGQSHNVSMEVLAPVIVESFR